LTTPQYKENDAFENNDAILLGGNSDLMDKYLSSQCGQAANKIISGS
jgi:hypothetical protein